MPKLKVYRTSTGFHDAYVAAPSQKAALEAWGSEHDLFARGVAEVVTDAALTKEPLAHPGEVIKRLRGTTAEQIAALPPDRPRKPSKREEPEKAEPSPPKKRQSAKPKPKPAPRPARTALDDAERALAEAEARHRAEAKTIAEEEAALARRRRKLEKDQEVERARLERERDRAEADYQRAMRKWRG
jgi:hypothetical protein